jgi:tetraacyldisaccharide 4'-kinase
MQNIFTSLIKELWQKSRGHNSLSLPQKLIFLSLYIFEYLYRLAFFVNQWLNRFCGRKAVPGYKIISVGNLTVGGTGKTVFIKFLANLLGTNNSAIVSRGYGSKSAGKNLLVGDGSTIFCSPEDCGDEPYMLAKSLSIVTAVGSDRYKSCLIINKLSKKPKYILLDDAYQNLQLKKDFEVLLVDSRFPLGINAHCLPAGDLREFDYTRADAIILTHADQVACEQILKIKNQILNKFDSSKIYCGIHKGVGLFQVDLNKIENDWIVSKKFILAAGIGSITGFVESVKSFGVSVESVIEFQDHHLYSRSDVDNLLKRFFIGGFDGIVVTQKDWVKLTFILTEHEIKYFFVFRIEFEFLSQAAYISFVKVLESKLK